LEGIVTTHHADGRVNVSPMGPVVDEAMNSLLLRPYQTSTTYQNLKRSGEGVLHVTDDVELLARAAVSQLEQEPALRPADVVAGSVLADACRWYEFRVSSIDASEPRTEIVAEVVARGRTRDFFGFNRAMHAVVEAAIVATRVEFLPPEEIRSDMDRLAVLVEKTGGPAERRAFSFLAAYIHAAIREAPAP
jgi:hypothetical protein